MNISDVIGGIRPIDKTWIDKASGRTAQLVMPPRALGRLHEFSERMCAIYETMTPDIEQKSIVVMAGDHGICDEGVSAFPKEVTGEMIKTFLRGGAGINALAGQVGAEVWVVDIGAAVDIDPSNMDGKDKLIVRKIGPGTANFAKGPAMTREQAEQAVMAGFEVASDLFKQGVKVLGTGDMGIGNTTPSAAVGHVITGKSLDVMVGRGTGVDDDGLARKRDAIKCGVELNKPEAKDGLDVLMKVGGFEIAGITGLILAAAYHRRVVMVDGFISTAGALIAQTICPASMDYAFSGHCSEEPGHKFMLEHLGFKPILDLGMRLGEGTGGALAMGVLDGANRMFKEMMTFEEAAVSESL